MCCGVWANGQGSGSAWTIASEGMILHVVPRMEGVRRGLLIRGSMGAGSLESHYGVVELCQWT